MKSTFPWASSLLVWLAGGALADTVTVGCAGATGSFDYTSITAALNALHAKSPRGHSVTVAGACTESVRIDDFQNLGVYGVPGGDARIVAPAPPALQIQRSRDVTIDRFVIEGASNGRVASVGMGGSVILRRCTLRGGGAEGLYVGGVSDVTLFGTTVADNASGILAAGGSLLVLGSHNEDLIPSAVTGNRGHGVRGVENAMVQVSHASITGNAGPGLVLVGARGKLGGSGREVQVMNNRAGVSLTGASLEVAGPALI